MVYKTIFTIKEKLVIQVWYPTHSTSEIKYPYIDFPEARVGAYSKTD